MRIRDRNGKDNSNSYFRKQITSWSSKHRNKKRGEKCYGLIFKKKTHERTKRHCSNGFCRILKFIEMIGVVISKSRWDVQHLEKCANHCLGKQPYKRLAETRFK